MSQTTESKSLEERVVSFLGLEDAELILNLSQSQKQRTISMAKETLNPGSIDKSAQPCIG